tara:strand:- start:66 stop:1148 length:1083 start_codon:yes stop_codon:yes gene_type:complete
MPFFTDDTEKYNPYNQLGSLVSNVQSYLPQQTTQQQPGLSNMNPNLPMSNISANIPTQDATKFVGGLQLDTGAGSTAPGAEGGLPDIGTAQQGATAFAMGNVSGGAGLGQTVGTQGGLGYQVTYTPKPVDPTDGGDDDYDPNAPEQSTLLKDFVSKLSTLSSKQQQDLLKFIGTDGVSSEEYAKLFGLPDLAYANRFQGLPSLMDLESQIGNVHRYGSQQRGFELASARQALTKGLGGMGMSGAFTGGRGFAGFGQRGASQSLQRSSLRETLKQRLASVRQSTADKYSQLLQTIMSSLGRGFDIAADIYGEGTGEGVGTGVGYVDTGGGKGAGGKGTSLGGPSGPLDTTGPEDEYSFIVE